MKGPGHLEAMLITTTRFEYPKGRISPCLERMEHAVSTTLVFVDTGPW